jgi:uncharacterized membrane protein
MSGKSLIHPEIYLLIITGLVFFPMMYLLQSNSNFDMWMFSMVFTAIIGLITLYTIYDMKKALGRTKLD